MHESFDKPTILRLLKQLDRRDARRRVFGSQVHQYRLQPPLDRSVIEAYEEQHAITFPDDYKDFMCEVGRGGAGPYCGLLPFGLDDDDRAWDASRLVGELAKPFPHGASWNLPDSFWKNQPDPPPGTPLEEEDRLMEAWDEELGEKYWNPAIMNGAIPICHLGCALRQWLVINGAQKGYVWGDDRVDYGGIYPVRNEAGKQLTFSAWYLLWLCKSLQETGLASRLSHALRKAGWRPT